MYWNTEVFKAKITVMWDPTEQKIKGKNEAVFIRRENKNEPENESILAKKK